MLRTTPPPSDRSPTTAWLSGLVLGVADGFLALEIPTIGLLLAGLAIILVALRGGRAAGFGGLAVGLGGTLVALLVNAQLQCWTAIWHACTEGPLTLPYFVAGLVILSAGIALTVIARSRGRT